MFKKIIRYVFSKVWGVSNKHYWYPLHEKPLRIENMTDTHLLRACKKLEPIAIRWATLNKEIIKRNLTPLKLKQDPLSTKIVKVKTNTKLDGYIEDIFMEGNFH